MFDSVKQHIDIVDHIGRYTDLIEHNGMLTGLCPLHEDSATPSLRVYPESQSFYCFGCERGRDVIDFEKHRRGLKDSENLEAAKLLAQEYGIPIDEKSSGFGYSVQSGRAFLGQRMTDHLLSEPAALEYLSNRGIDENDIREWGIGLSIGEELYAECKEKYKNDKGKPDYEFLFQIGVANRKDAKFWSFIRPGMIMYPVRNGRFISHFQFKPIDGSDKYQALNEHRDGGLFFNQKVLDKKGFWLVEGPEDVISMTKAGYAAAATMGSVSKSQVEYLQSLCKFSDTFKELTVEKTVHILFDRDENLSGQERAVRLAGDICAFHKVFVHILEGEKDPDLFIRKGGDIKKLERVAITKSRIPIKEKNGRYFFESGDGKSRILTNFTMSVAFQVQDPEGWKSYMVKLKKDGRESQLHEVSSKNWKNETGFREWLGRCGGTYILRTSGRNDIYDLVCHIFETSRPKTMKILYGYGEVEPGLWAWDNAVFYNGKIEYADDDGVIWLEGYETDGVKTITSYTGNQVTIPKKFHSVEKVITDLCRFWPVPQFAWTLMGYAAATIFFRPLSEKYHWFPVLFGYGPTQNGKTHAARELTSLCGGALIKSPSGDSTGIGLRRHLSRVCSIPVPVNEFKGMISENVIRSMFDLDPHIMGIKTMDNRTRDTSYHTSGMMTAIYSPREKDVINRCIMLDFHEFEKKVDDETKKAYDEMLKHKQMNAGFLFAVLKSGAHKRLMSEIQKVQSYLLDKVEDVESRQLECYSVIFGALFAIGKELGFREIFKKIGFPAPTMKLLADIVKSLHRGARELLKHSEMMTYFFELIDHLIGQEKLKGIADLSSDGPGEDRRYLRIHLSSVLQECKKEEARSGVSIKRIANLTTGEVSKNLKVRLNIDTKRTSSINGINRRHHTIYLHEIKKEYGYGFGE